MATPAEDLFKLMVNPMDRDHSRNGPGEGRCIIRSALGAVPGLLTSPDRTSPGLASNLVAFEATRLTFTMPDSNELDTGRQLNIGQPRLEDIGLLRFTKMPAIRKVVRQIWGMAGV